MAITLTCEERLQYLSGVERGFSSALHLLQKAALLRDDMLRQDADPANLAGGMNLQLTNLAAETVTNGTFDADSDWSLGGNWAFDTDHIEHTASDATAATQVYADQVSGFELVEFNTYLVGYTIAGYSAGSVAIRLGSEWPGIGVSRSANGTYFERLICWGSTTISLVPTATFVGEIDDVTVKRIRGVAGILLSALSDLAGIPWVYAERVEVNPEESYVSCDIDADDAGNPGHAVLTASGGTPFSVFSASDRIEIMKCEESANNALRTLDTATNTVLTLDDTLTTDNADDEKIVIVLRQR